MEQIPDAATLEPTDAVVKITYACICGTDLWPSRGQRPYHPGRQIGHEWRRTFSNIKEEILP